MPFVGMGYITLGQQVSLTGPGGVTIYRVLSTCSCGAKFEWILPYDRREQELQIALGRISEHWLEHMK